jgi:hypothetical protein
MTKRKHTKTKIKILLPPAGRFGLSYDVGKTYTIDSKQAAELIEAKYAVKTK